MTTELPLIQHSHIDGDTAELVLLPEETLTCFQGHFPGFPILPGLAQIHWAYHLAQKYLAVQGECMAMDNVKFKQIISPAVPITLHLSMDRIRLRLNFRYSSPKGEHSSGQFILQPV